MRTAGEGREVWGTYGGGCMLCRCDSGKEKGGMVRHRGSEQREGGTDKERKEVYGRGNGGGSGHMVEGSAV